MNENTSIDRLQILLKKYGSDALQKAKESVLCEPIDCEIVVDALHYFIGEYWQDYTTPTLLFLSYEMVEGDRPRQLVDLASAMILIHGAIDIHDDIVDRSRRKDGRPTVYGRFGNEVALLIGDALFTKGCMMLAETCQNFGIEKTWKISSLLKCGLFELGEAEALELKFRRTFAVRPKEYLKVMHKKAADVEALMRIGAFLGNAGKHKIETLGKYGRVVGLLSIIRDDFIDMMSREELIHRIRYECLPLPLLYAIEKPKTNIQLVRLLQRGIRTDSDLEEIHHLTQKAYGFERAIDYVNRLVEEGKMLASNFGKKSQKLDFVLNSLTTFIELDRD